MASNWWNAAPGELRSDHWRDQYDDCYEDWVGWWEERWQEAQMEEAIGEDPPPWEDDVVERRGTRWDCINCR